MDEENKKSEKKAISTYEAMWHCYNCNVVMCLDVPKRTSIKAYLENKSLMCEYCGCNVNG